jgi:hypothetical protein
MGGFVPSKLVFRAQRSGAGILRCADSALNDTKTGILRFALNDTKKDATRNDTKTGILRFALNDTKKDATRNDTKTGILRSADSALNDTKIRLRSE